MIEESKPAHGRQCDGSPVTKQARDLRWEEWNLLYASADVWTKRMLAGLREGIKGKKWFSLADKVWREKSLLTAFDRVKKNQGSAGTDGQSIAAYGARLEENTTKLSGQLRNGRYQRRAIRRIEIEKNGSKEKRPLGIPCVRDRVVETSIKMAIEPIFDVDFSPSSHGFRPGLGCRSALQAVKDQLESGKVWVVDADVQGYFDNIDHDLLLQRVEEKISDGRILKWIRQALKTSIFDGLENWTPEKGSPQGSVLSPLLANIYLDALDQVLDQAGISFVRYADDFVLLCESREEAEAGLQLVTAWCTENKLCLHPEKTKLVEVRKDSGFDFLGYHFRNRNHWPGEKGRKNLRNKLRPLTKRNNGKSMQRIIEEINPVIRGWFHYFKYCKTWQLEAMDGWIRGRLRSIKRRRCKRKGRGRGKDHQRWPNSHFDELGLFCLVEAHESFCESQEVIVRWQLLPSNTDGNH